MPQKIYITVPHMRQNFIKNHKIIKYGTMDKIIKRDYPEVYKGLPAQSSQQVLRLIEKCDTFS